MDQFKQIYLLKKICRRNKCVFNGTIPIVQHISKITWPLIKVISSIPLNCQNILVKMLGKLKVDQFSLKGAPLSPKTNGGNLNIIPKSTEKSSFLKSSWVWGTQPEDFWRVAFYHSSHFTCVFLKSAVEQVMLTTVGILKQTAGPWISRPHGQSDLRDTRRHPGPNRRSFVQRRHFHVLVSRKLPWSIIWRWFEQKQQKQIRWYLFSTHSEQTLCSPVNFFDSP